MRNKELFLEALNTMMYSWGSDPPAEVHWALDTFLRFYQYETGHFLDVPEYDEEGTWADAVLTAIRNDGNDDAPENENPEDMGPDDHGLQEEIKRIKRLL